jgi:hypothetical protein
VKDVRLPAAHNACCVRRTRQMRSSRVDDQPCSAGAAEDEIIGSRKILRLPMLEEQGSKYLVQAQPSPLLQATPLRAMTS